jgi:CrcB protein
VNPALAAAVIVAGALGAAVRFGVAHVFAPRTVFPWAVLVVNVVGSALGGAVLALAMRDNVSADIRLIIVTGLCGGLTTFSTLSVEAIQLTQDGHWRTAVASIAANLVVGIGCAAAAFALVMAF